MFISDCMNKLEFPCVNKREVDTKNITLLGQSGASLHGSLELHFFVMNKNLLIVFYFPF